MQHQYQEHMVLHVTDQYAHTVSGHIQHITECFSHVSGTRSQAHAAHNRLFQPWRAHESIHARVCVQAAQATTYASMFMYVLIILTCISNSRSSIHCTVNLQRPLNTERPLCIFSGSLMYTVLLGIPGQAPGQRSHQLRQKSAAFSKPGSRCPFLVIRCPMFRAVSLAWA